MASTIEVLRNNRIVLLWWVACLIIYTGSLLLIKPNIYYYLGSSLGYHLLLTAFPLWMLVRGREKTADIGFVIGDFKGGLFYILLLISALLFAFVTIYVFFKNVTLTTGNLSNLITLTASLYILISPLTEEIFYRGYLQSKFRHAGKKAELILVSIMFSLMHLPKIIIAYEYISVGSVPILSSTFIPEFLRTSMSLSTFPISINGITILLLLIYFFGLGLFLSFVRSDTGSVWYSVVLHVIFNGLVCFVSL